MRAGLSMGEIDRMDLLRYLHVMARELALAEEQADRQEGPDAEIGSSIELRRGTIDTVLG